MVHYFKQSCLLMLWALFLVNISFTSCDDKNPEVQIGALRYSIGESKLGKLR